MKAIRVKEFGGPDVLRLEEIPDLIPEMNQVVVKQFAIGVNPVDIGSRAGLFSWVTPPFTPGQDGAGIIARIGSGVRNVKEGDRVYLAFNASGSYAEEVLCDTSQVYPLPDGTGFEEGAGVFIPYGTAYRGLYQRCQVKAGETVLVHGASGAVGIAATQFAAAEGCIVIGSAGNERDRSMVLDQGAKFVVDHYRDDHYQRILELTNGRGVDVILEMVSANVKRDVPILAKYGRIAVIGDRNPIEIDAQSLTERDGAILGTNIGNIPPSSREELHSTIYRGLQDKRLRPVIGGRFPLIDAKKAHEAIFRPETFGKLILIP